MAPEYLILVNPVSGHGRARRLAERVAACLRGHRHVVQVAYTAARGEARRLAAEAAEAGTGVVAGCGGDGTLQEIAAALLGARTALGFLPGGRCNDLARALGIAPHLPPEALALILAAGETRPIDVGRCVPLEAAAGGAAAGRIFCTVATLGFDSEVTRFVDQRRLWVKGTAAYLYGVLRVLARYRPPRVRIESEGGNFEGRILLAATGNAPSYGGAMRIAPGARLDDGLFQVCVVREIPRLELLRMVPKVFRGGHVGHPAVRLLNARALTIHTPDGPQWVCADGESLAQTPVRLEVVPGALRVRVPAPAANGAPAAGRAGA